MIKCYKGLFIPLHEGFPSGTVLKNLPAKAGDVRDVGLIPGLGSSPGVRNGNSLQYSCLENLMDRGDWWATELQRVRHDGATECTHTHRHMTYTNKYN